MDLGEIYHFLFETYYGLGILVGAGLIISVLVSIIMECRTRKQFKNHEKATDGESWSFFEDEEEADTKEDN